MSDIDIRSRKEIAILNQEVSNLKQLILNFFIITDSTITFNQTWFLNQDIRNLLREIKGEII